jgi:hypothetical protein
MDLTGSRMGSVEGFLDYKIVMYVYNEHNTPYKAATCTTINSSRWILQVQGRSDKWLFTNGIKSELLSSSRA